MQHREAETATLALAILRNQGWRFIAVSPSNHVVSHMQDDEPLVVTAAKPSQTDKEPASHRTKRRRRTPYLKILGATDYKNIMLEMSPGDTHIFPAIPGVPMLHLSKALGNAAYRFFGKGEYVARTMEREVIITRKAAHQ